MEPQNGSIELVVSTEYYDVEEFGPDIRYTAWVEDNERTRHRLEKSVSPDGTAGFSNLGVEIQIVAGVDPPAGCDGDSYGFELKHDEPFRRVHFTVTCRLVDAERAGLKLEVMGLPDGVASDITLSQGSFSATVSQTQTFLDLEPGAYEIRASPVAFGPAIYNPQQEHQGLVANAGRLTTVTIQYVVSPVALNIDVSGVPDGSASVTVSGPDGFSRTLQGSETLEGLTPGTYTVSANTVTVGGTHWQPTPRVQTVELVSGDSKTATIDYAEVVGIGSMSLSVTGMPIGWDADVTLTDPFGGTVQLKESGTLADLVPGVYTVAATAVEADYHMEPEVASQDVVVTAGATASVEVSYLTVSANLLVDPSWEIGLVSVASPVIPKVTGTWHGDLADTTGAENGIQPADGVRMLHCIASGPFGPGAGSTGCEMYQLLAVPPELVDAITGGTASVAARALFDRVAGDAETDSRFTVDIFAFDGAPADAPAKVGAQAWLARQVVDLDTDAVPETWEPIQSVVAVPSGTTVLLLRLVAVENVKDDATHPELDGHYMDEASLVIRWKR